MKCGKLTLEKPFLWPVERFLIGVILIFGTIDLITVLVRDIGFDWYSYAILLGLGNIFFGVGWFFRSVGRYERISLAAIATGIYISFTVTLSIFNYLLLPLWREPIDPFLVQIDTWLGYSWPEIVNFAGHHPFFNELTRYSYLSLISQIAVVGIVLGFCHKQKELHVFILAITVTSIAMLGFWILFPTFGTSTIHDIPGEIEQAARPLVGTAYGAKLLRLGTEGPTYITPLEIEGLVAFPSYHTTMAVLATYASRTIPLLFPIICVINVFVLPGALIHGGHHLVDLFGGFIFAFVGIYLTRNLVTEKDILPYRELVAARSHSQNIHRRQE